MAASVAFAGGRIGALLGVFGLCYAPLLCLGLVFASVGSGFLYLIVGMLGLFVQTLSAQRTQQGATQFALMGSTAFTLTRSLIWTLRQ